MPKLKTDRIKFIFCLFLAGVVSSAFAEVTAIESLDADLALAYREIREISPDLVRGEKTPEWKDFDRLETITTALSRGLARMRSSGRLKELEQAADEIEKSIPNDPQLSRLRERSESPRSNDYRPTEYELKLGYQKLLQNINSELPEALQISGVRLLEDPRPKLLLEKARELVRNLETKFENLYQTTGYKNESDLVSRTVEQEPLLGEVYEVLKNERLELTVRRPKQARWWIPRVGFQNQFVTGSSRGYYTPTGRNHAEAGFLAIEPETYSTFDNELKPKYGSLRPMKNSGLQSGAGDTYYGEDVYILKTDAVRDRLTINSGDTNNRLAMNFSNWESQSHQAQSWDQLFIPWRFRALLGPMLLSDYKTHKRIGYPSSPNEMLKMKWTVDTAYWEIQIFGPLNLDHVAKFEYTSAPPEGEFLEELQRRKIEIRKAN